MLDKWPSQRGEAKQRARQSGQRAEGDVREGPTAREHEVEDPQRGGLGEQPREEAREHRGQRASEA
jgi:hypothetical protein